MCLIKWMQKKLKKFTVADYAILKTDVALVGIIIGAYISNFVKIYLWYFIVAAVVLYILLWRSMLKK